MKIAQRVLWIVHCTVSLWAVIPVQASASSDGFGPIRETRVASTDFEYAYSIIYPATAPAGSPGDQLGNMIAIEGSLAIAADVGGVEGYDSPRSDRLLVFRKIAEEWGVGGQIRPYWESLRQLRLISIGLSDGRAILLGSIAPGTNAEYSVLEIFGESENGWSREGGVAFETGTPQPKAMKVSNGMAYVATSNGANIEVAIFDLSSSMPTRTSSTGPIDGLQNSNVKSLAVDGDRIAIGAENPYLGEGKVVLLRKSSSEWLIESTLQDSAQHQGDGFGYNVQIDDDLVAVSSPFRNQGDSGPGAITLFGYESQGWSRRALILSPSTDVLDRRFGFCLDLSSSSLLTCTSSDPVPDYRTSRVFSYPIENGSVALEPSIVLTPKLPLGLSGNFRGPSLRSVVRDGASIMLGAPFEGPPVVPMQGALLFMEDMKDATVNQQWRYLSPSRAGYRFGTGIANGIANNSEWLAVGSPGRMGMASGIARVHESVRMYRRVGSDWQFTSEIAPGDFPYALASTIRIRNGELVAVNYDPGRVQIVRYRNSGNSWWRYRYEELPVAGDQAYFDLGPDFVAIYRSESNILSIRRLGDTWTPWVDLPIPNYYIGLYTSVSAASDFIAISLVDEVGPFAQIVERSSAGWILGPQFRPASTGLPNSTRIRILASDRGLLIADWTPVCCRSVDEPTPYGTTLRFFPRSASGWGEAEPLLPPANAIPGGFASAFFLEGDRAYVGTALRSDPIAGSASAAVLLYERQADGWVQIGETTIPDKSAYVGSISKREDEILVGMPYSDPLDEGAGLAGKVAVLVPNGQLQMVFADGFESESGRSLTSEVR